MSVWICGSLILSAPERLAEERATLPRPLPVDGGPVFAEPWQAQAFALTVSLHQAGVFTWQQWAEALAAQLTTAPDDDGGHYYDHWLLALEGLVTGHGLLQAAEMAQRRDAWEQAYLETPHGKPVELVGKV